MKIESCFLCYWVCKNVSKGYRMQVLKEQVVEQQVQPKAKKGVWEVLLTDPSLNKFTFGPSLIGHYIMTDIVSPYGQKSVLYSTISEHGHDSFKIDLDFERIDECDITGIQLVSTSLFFTKWKVSIVDNRSGERHYFSGSELLEVEPKIAHKKLFGLGFMPEKETKSKCFFELLIQKK